MSATLRLTREGTGIELRRGLFEILVDGKSLVLQPDFVTCGAGVLDAERPPLDDHGL